MDYKIVKSDDFANIEVAYSALKQIEKSFSVSDIYTALKQCKNNKYGSLNGVSSKSFYEFLIDNKKITQESIKKLNVFHKWEISTHLYPSKLLRLLNLYGIHNDMADDICCYFIALFAAEDNKLRKTLFFLLRDILVEDIDDYKYSYKYSIDLIDVPTNITDFILGETQKENLKKEIILNQQKQEKLIQMFQDNIELIDDGEIIATFILIAKEIGLDLN